MELELTSEEPKWSRILEKMDIEGLAIKNPRPNYQVRENHFLGAKSGFWVSNAIFLINGLNLV